MHSQKELNQNIYASLKELGLKKHEITLYTLSLALGPTSISKLAKHLAISRPNVYKVITGLEERGLVKFAEHKHLKRTFMVESPAVVLKLLRQKRKVLASLEENVTQAMPQLLAFYHQGELPTSIRIIQGKEQFLNLFRSIIDETQDTSEFFGSVKDFISFISWAEERRWIRKRTQKALQIKALLLPSKDADALKATDIKELRETRILKVKSPFITSFQLFANKVIIWQPKAPLAVLIEDEYITKMLRSIFYTLWALSLE